MKDGKYEESDLEFFTLDKLSRVYLPPLVQHVANLTEAQDDEDPESYLGWILQHGCGYLQDQALLLAKGLLRSAANDSLISLTALCQVILTEWYPARPNNYLPPHRIYLAYEEDDRDDMKLAAIAGFVPDDRDVGLHEKLAEKDPEWIGFFGGHNVRSDLRGKGIGSLMIKHRCNEIQFFVDRSWRKPATVYSFLTNEQSGRNLVKHGGFEYVGVWHINYFNNDQHIFRRRFVPAGNSGC